MIALADPDYKVTVVITIMLRLFIDFPQLRLFKDHAVSEVRKLWMRSRVVGLDDEVFFAAALSMPGRMTIAAAVLGDMAGYQLGCGAPSLKTEQQGLRHPLL